jgi:glycosyltransferase involved in cell wall biosynthesis
MAKKRKPGISVLIACQNEEAMVGLCLHSFLEFGDELIVVDNGSTDHTKEIVRDLQAQYPAKIKFFDRPELTDLYQNRQFAFEQSSHEWLLRADSDFVAYTDGENDIMCFREYLLKRKRQLRPETIAVPMGSVIGDFWHTGVPMRPGGYRANPERAQVPEAILPPGVRFYRHFPFFKFLRHGRREVVRFWRLMKRIYWDRPLWMHCNIKSDMNHFFRSERTNWREFGDFKRFGTLRSYIESIIEEKYGTSDLAEAASIYMQRHVLPYLEPYDPKKYYPYPTLVAEQMEKNPIYRIYEEQGKLKRRFCGIDYPPNQNQND